MAELVSGITAGVASLTTATRHDSDAALMQAVARGDQAAFERVYELHRGRAFRLAYGILLDREEAREAVQEAFVRLHKAAARWEPQAALGTWIHRVVLNYCLSLKHRLLRLVPRVALPSRSTSPELSATLAEAVQIVELVLRDLAPRQRAVLTLHLEGELAPAEIAQLLDITPNATRVTLHRGLERLRTELNARGIDAAPTEDHFPDHEEQS